jgi:NDP-sugar pyrophosphorylase family protein
MAHVAGRPFLELLLSQLQRHRFDRVILAVGYRKDVICSYFGERAFGLNVAYSVESSPLGTGGALRNAANLVQTDTVLVMNGDSYTEVDLDKFLAHHANSGSDVSLVVVPADGRGDTGTIRVGADGSVASFEEKRGFDAARHINAGIYAIPRRLLDDIQPERKISLEQEIFPRWLAEGKHLSAFVHSGPCVDIGTPERYWGAQHSLADVEAGNTVVQSEGKL